MRKVVLLMAVFMAAKTNAQQIVRASGNVQIVTTAGTKTVINGGGITFMPGSKWIGTADSIYLIKTSATGTEGWLDSTLAGAMDVPSTSHVFFSGSNRQSFYGKTRFYDFTLRNTGGDTLLSSCEVRGNLHLDTGRIYTLSGYGNDSLLVSNTAIAAISSTSSYTKSWVNGRLSRTGNIVGTPSSNFYLFPVGKTDTLYAPIKLAKGNTTINTWTAEYTNDVPFNRTNIRNPPIDHISSVEYWEITSNNQGTTSDDAQLSLSWRGYSRVSNTLAIRDALIVAQYIQNPGFIWEVPGGWVTGNTVGADSLFGYVNSNLPSNNYTFAERRFTLGTLDQRNPLPVKLIYFTAIADGNRVRLNWEAANEQDTRTYEIEKSLTGSNFTFLGSVNSRQLSQSAYTDFDLNPALGWNYYRLKIIDKGGNFFYSPIRPVKFEKGLEQVHIFPVPASTVLNIQLPSSYVNKSHMQVFGVDGKLIATLQPSVNMVKLNVQPLAAATYFLIIIKEDGTKETYRFVKQ